jgi:hypothetical protein
MTGINADALEKFILQLIKNTFFTPEGTKKIVD